MADSKKQDKDSEHRSPAFTKALMGRIGAVGLFVVLGTFAVASSMDYFGTADEQVATVDEGAEATTSAAAAKPPALPTVTGNYKTPATTSSKNGFAIRPPSFGSKPSAPKVPAVNASFGAKPFSKAQSASSSNMPLRSTASSRLPVIKPVRTTITPVAAAKPMTRPQTTQSPTIQNGFEAFKTNVVQTTGDLVNKAGETARDTINKTSDAVGRGLNGLTVRNPVSSSSKPAAKPFPLPSSTSSRDGFGSRPVEKKPAVSFDTSRNLKPVSRQSTSRSSAASSSPSSRSSFGDASSSGRSSFGGGSPISRPSRQQDNSSRPVVSSPSRPFAPSSKPRSFDRDVRPSPTVRSSAGSAGTVSVAAQTSDAPGDRELEGVQAPALTVEKLSPREIQVNREAEFAIVVRNVGRVMARDVRVFDEIPAGTEFLTSVPKPNRTGQRLDWKIGELRPGQEKRITVQLKPTRPGEIGSVAHVTFATQATMRTRVTKPILEIRHSARPQALIGDPVVFDVVVENKGDGPATNVIVQEDVPEQLEYADGYRELEYEIGTLMPGQSKRVQLGLKAAQIGRLRNVMFASASGGLRAKHEIDMEVVAPKLVTSTEGATRRFLQRNVEHQFSIENDGTAKATNVELVARLPSGLRFVTANNQGRYDQNSHAVYWSLAELQPSIKAAVTLETRPVDVGKQDISFEAFADLNQKSSSTQPLSVEHLVDVFFDIDDVVDPIEIGSDTSYRIRVVNQGTKTATNVKLAVDFPNGIQPTGVEGNLRNDIRGQQVLFAPISSMGPGDEIRVIVRGQGKAAGDHRGSVNLQTDGRQTEVTKEETTRVYADR
jgi:uncharacterized repeat protein (TIGR01451 family)